MRCQMCLLRSKVPPSSRRWLYSEQQSNPVNPAAERDGSTLCRLPLSAPKEAMRFAGTLIPGLWSRHGFENPDTLETRVPGGPSEFCASSLESLRSVGGEHLVRIKGSERAPELPICLFCHSISFQGPLGLGCIRSLLNWLLRSS